MRVSYHPGPFNVLGSTRQDVIHKAVAELDQHAYLMDLMGLEQSTYYPINIHVGTTQPSREVAAKKFCENTELFTLAESLGGVESLVNYPAEMTHASASGTPIEVSGDIVRLSVGVEHISDIIADLTQALERL